MHPGLAHIDAWIFDLDNSLYPHSFNLFELVDRRIGPTQFEMRRRNWRPSRDLHILIATPQNPNR